MSTAVNITNPDQNVLGTNWRQAQWPALANGETGLQTDLAQFSDRSVQVAGTFGAAGSVQLEGSNDGTTWVVLRDPQGVTLVFAAAGLKAVLEMTRYVRAHCTAGDGTTALVITLFAKATV